MGAIIVLGIVAALLAVFFLRRANESEILMKDIPDVFEALKTTGKGSSWAQLCFGVQDKTVADVAVNLQFSIEERQIGFDWCLLCEVNVRDKERFRNLAEQLGHQVTEHKYPNGAESLRAEGGDLVKLCEKILVDFYQWDPHAKIGLIADGFAWPRGKKSQRADGR